MVRPVDVAGTADPRWRQIDFTARTDPSSIAAFASGGGKPISWVTSTSGSPESLAAYQRCPTR